MLYHYFKGGGPITRIRHLNPDDPEIALITFTDSTSKNKWYI